MSYVMIFFLVLILAALAAAGYFMVRTPRDPQEGEQPKVSPMTRALTLRIGLSVLLFIGILVSWKMGWIHPTGIPR